MFKLVVFAFLAVVAAEPEPGTLIGLPYSTYPAILSPGSTTITKQASSVVHPSPYFISSPLVYPHFIKKRSATLPLGYFAPTTYLASAPLATTYTAPLVHSTPILPAVPALPYVSAAHLIKKRSVSLLPYITPTTYAAATPLLATTYAAPHYTTPIISSTPLISSPITHLIKKRSAPLFGPIVSTPYLAPTSYSHQSRIDLHSTPLINTFHTPLVLPHVF